MALRAHQGVDEREVRRRWHQLVASLAEQDWDEGDFAALRGSVRLSDGAILTLDVVRGFVSAQVYTEQQGPSRTTRIGSIEEATAEIVEARRRRKVFRAAVIAVRERHTSSFWNGRTGLSFDCPLVDHRRLVLWCEYESVTARSESGGAVDAVCSVRDLWEGVER